MYHLVESTFSLRSILEILQKNKKQFYLKRMSFFKLVNPAKSTITYNEWSGIFGKHQLSTSHNVLASAYIHSFITKEMSYRNCMSTISLNQENPWISCDHTFRIAGMYILAHYNIMYNTSCKNVNFQWA